MGADTRVIRFARQRSYDWLDQPPRPFLIDPIGITEAGFEVLLFRNDGQPRDQHGEYRNEEDDPDVFGQLGETDQDQHVGQINGISAEAKWPISDQYGCPGVGKDRRLCATQS